MAQPPTPVDPNQSFPDLEEEVLERWRERDVFHESMRRRAGARAVGLLRGPADGERPPRLPPRARARVQGHLPALQDDARVLRRAQGRLGLPRAAGRDRGRAAARASARRPRSRRYGIAEFNQKCRESVFEFLEDWDRADRADRLLDRPRRRLPHARPDLHRVGLVGAEADLRTRASSTRATRSCPYCPRCGTALSCHEVAQGYEDVVDPSVYVRFPVRRARPARCAGRRRAARLDDDAVDARLERRGRRRRRPRRTCARGSRAATRRSSSPRRSSSACSARAPRSSSASRAPRSRASRYEPPFPFLARRGLRPERPHGAARATSSRPRTASGLVHTAVAFGEDDFRLGRAGRPDGRQPGAARRHLRRAHRPVRRALRQGRRRRPRRGPARARPAAARRGATSTPTRTAGAAARRCSTTPSPPGTSRPRRSATACWPPTRRRLAPRAHQGGALRRLAARTTSTGRSRASATGARRCRSGAARTTTRT